MTIQDKNEKVGWGEMAERLGTSERSAMRAVERGEIPSFPIGRRRIVPRILFEKMMRGELIAIEAIARVQDYGSL